MLTQGKIVRLYNDDNGSVRLDELSGRPNKMAWSNLPSISVLSLPVVARVQVLPYSFPKDMHNAMILLFS